MPHSRKARSPHGRRDRPQRPRQGPLGDGRSPAPFATSRPAFALPSRCGIGAPPYLIARAGDWLPRALAAPGTRWRVRGFGGMTSARRGKRCAEAGRDMADLQVPPELPPGSPPEVPPAPPQPPGLPPSQPPTVPPPEPPHAPQGTPPETPPRPPG